MNPPVLVVHFQTLFSPTNSYFSCAQKVGNQKGKDCEKKDVFPKFPKHDIFSAHLPVEVCLL